MTEQTLLEQEALAALARQTADYLANIFDPEAHPIQVIESSGICVCEGRQFTCRYGSLVLIDHCPVCNGRACSRPIDTLADLGEEIREFNPAAHYCPKWVG